MNAAQDLRCRCGCIHKVVIYMEGCKYRVEPGRLVVHQGATVRLISMVGPRVVDAKGVDLPEVDLRLQVKVWAPAGLTTPSPLLIGHGKPVVVDVGNETGVFPYSVYVPGAHGADFAEGGSSPRIIVADP